jgi:hypothetical protein
MRGIIMANKTASTYDGTNDYFLRTSALSGVSDSKKATISVWFKVASSAATQYIYTIYTGSATYFYLRLSSTGYLSFLTKDASGNLVVYVDSSTSGWSDNAWHHAMISFDASQAQASYLHFYIDGVSRIGLVTSWTNADIKWSNQYSSFGSYNTGGLIGGVISEFWMAIGLYTDLSVLANRQLFYISGRAPLVTGNGLGTPALYFPSGDAASNSGSGGNYTAVGAVDTATGVAVFDIRPILYNYRQRRI